VKMAFPVLQWPRQNVDRFCAYAHYVSKQGPSIAGALVHGSELRTGAMECWNLPTSGVRMGAPREVGGVKGAPGNEPGAPFTVDPLSILPEHASRFEGRYPPGG